MKNKKIYTYIALILSMIFWGYSFVWGKIALAFYTPVTIIVLRLVISTIIMFFILLILKQFQKIQKQDIKWFLLFAFFEPFLYFMGETNGLNLVSASTTSIIIGTIPVFTPFAAYLVLKEKIKLANIVGILISFVGILILVLKRDFSLTDDPKGLAFLFLAVFAAMGYAVLIKKLADRYKLITILFWQNLIGLLYFIPFFLFNGHFEHLMQTGYVPEAMKNVIYLAIFGSTLAFLLFMKGVKEFGATRSNTFTNFIPVITMILCIFMLNEELTLKKIIGMGIVIAGVSISELKLKRKKA